MTWDRQTYAVAIPSAAVAAVAIVAGVVIVGHIEVAAHPSTPADCTGAVDGLIYARRWAVVPGAGHRPGAGPVAAARGARGHVVRERRRGVPYGPLSAAVAAWPAIALSWLAPAGPSRLKRRSAGVPGWPGGG